MSAGFEFLLVTIIVVWCIEALIGIALALAGAPAQTNTIVRAIGLIVILLVGLPLLGLSIG